MFNELLRPYRCGDIEIANRVVMAPLTRSRADAEGIPSKFAADYYQQRASAGLIVTEATTISTVARGFANTPGIYTQQQQDAWQPITQAVHEQGGKIVCQLWHTGRVSSELLHPGEANVSSVAGSCDSCRAFIIDDQGRGRRVPVTPARQMSAADITDTIDDYVNAARRAQAAGFDGVEIHAANGYLLQQFLASGVNTRSDSYGGSPENRCRFLLEVVDAVSEVIGGGRVGVRLSPLFTGSGTSDPDATETYHCLAEALQSRTLSYVHLADSNVMAPGVQPIMSEVLSTFGDAYSGPLILNGGYDAERAAVEVRVGRADAIAFGRPFISNPDLVTRIEQGIAWTAAEPKTFYGGGKEGYTDWPAAT